MKKVLIIEDDQSLASAYRVKLSPHFETKSVITGDDGIKITNEWLPDFIILDLFLIGDKTGQEVLAELKKNPKTKKIPVMVLTNLEGQCQKVLEMGASDCFIKTEMTMDSILKKINTYLQ